MAKTFWSKLKESIISILPIALVVIILTLIFVPNSGWSIFCFSICSLLLIVGICLFNIGIDNSLLKMGGYVGAHLSKTKKIFLMIICSLFIGIIVTIAEPDLLVLANQVPWINRWVFIISIGVSVGVCLVVAVPFSQSQTSIYIGGLLWHYFDFDVFCSKNIFASRF